MPQTSVNNIGISHKDTSRSLADSKGLGNVCGFIISCPGHISSYPYASCALQSDGIPGSRSRTSDKIENRTATSNGRLQRDRHRTVNHIAKITQFKGSCRLCDGQGVLFFTHIIGIINGCGHIIDSLVRGTGNHHSVRIPVNQGNGQAFNRRGGRDAKDVTSVALGGIGHCHRGTQFCDSQRAGSIGECVVAGGKTCRCCHIGSSVRHSLVVANCQTGGNHSRHSSHSWGFYRNAIIFIRCGYCRNCFCGSGFTSNKTTETDGCSPIRRGRGAKTIGNGTFTQIGRQGRGINGVTGGSIPRVPGIRHGYNNGVSVCIFSTCNSFSGTILVSHSMRQIRRNQSHRRRLSGSRVSDSSAVYCHRPDGQDRA